VSIAASAADDFDPRERALAIDRRLREIMEEAADWVPVKRAQLFDIIQNELGGERRAWYCQIDGKPGRHCNGEPHAGYEYPHARADQWPPLGTDWLVWFLSSGRGSGKTRTGAEYTRRMAQRLGPNGRIALVAPTAPDVRDTMIEGISGLEYVCALAGERIEYEPTKRRVTFANGCIATAFTAEKPKRLRGPQHHFAWLDEPAHYEKVEEVWSNLLFGLRLGDRPHVLCSSTPIPSEWVKGVQADPDTRVVRVSTYANLANLASNYRKTVAQFEGTRLGKQELEGEVLADVEGALWKNEMIRYELGRLEELHFDRIVVSIDPAGTANKRSDETGIVVVARLGDTLYVLDDLSGKYSPEGWAAAAYRAYERWGADAFVAEKNFGGDMVKANIETYLAKQKVTARVIVATASRSKALRAEPVVMLYEQKRALHRKNLQRTEVKPNVFRSLETEMLEWVPATSTKSPNRVDALVHGASELFKLGDGGPAHYAAPKGKLPSNPALAGLTSRRSPWRKSR
jgi:phage terminase large subunit-like protein